jgi:hypothetical protein
MNRISYLSISNCGGFMKASSVATLVPTILVLVTSFVVGEAWAQDSLATLAELKAKGARLLTKADVEKLATGAAVENRAGTASVRYWKNAADGTFVASSTNVGPAGVNRPTQGQGTWKVDDDGRFCVNIEWPRSTENWCRGVYEVTGSTYTVSGTSDQARAYLTLFKR